MSLFQCDVCGCCDNTALALCRYPFPQDFDWTGIEDRKEKALCSACAPAKYGDGTPTEFGKWHGQFARTFLPLGMFKTNRVGNLAHIETGDEDYRKYAVAGSAAIGGVASGSQASDGTRNNTEK
jgi:hypothetical protein